MLREPAAPPVSGSGAVSQRKYSRSDMLGG
jgi:hypothetical protein